MKIKIKNKDKAIILLLIVLVLLTKFGVILKQDNMYIDISENLTQVEIQKKIIYKVHIDGEVINPGVYDVNEEERLDTLIIKAGGLTINADASRINLARLLEDGLKIYIPNKENAINSNSSIEDNKLTLTDFNQLSKEELIKIDGVGEVIASRIIDYKNENGSFKKVSDLLNVNGIGEKKLEQIKNIIY